MAKAAATTATRTSKVVRSARALRGVTTGKILADGTRVEGGLELRHGNQFLSVGAKFEYGKYTVTYTKEAKYKPDWILHNGIIIESKGWFPSEDRSKMKLVKEQWPKLDIRVVFSRSASKIGKKSNTTYGMWCVKYGFPYADENVPLAWINEPPTPERLAAVEEAFGWRP